jgi:hypothetical protein
MWPKPVEGHPIINKNQNPIAHLSVLISYTFFYSSGVIGCIWQNLPFGFF